MVSSVWESLVSLIIRPQRAVYDASLNLGSKFFWLEGRLFQRIDFTLCNPRSLKIECSFFCEVKNHDSVSSHSHCHSNSHFRTHNHHGHGQSAKSSRIEGVPSVDNADVRPCVIYCHGNCGCRCDGIEAARVLLPSGLHLLVFDFTGSGVSEGEYVSLGYFEKEDLTTVCSYARAHLPVSTIGLWGRSMGAATAIMYAAEDPSIAGIVLDSPFAKLTQIMHEMVKSYKGWIPSMLIAVAIKAMRKSIKARAKFDIFECDPLQYAPLCFVPALFGHATGDEFVKIHHSEAVFSAYGGDKNFVRLPGDHNSERPDFWLDSVCIFFYNTLVLPASSFGDALHHRRPAAGFSTSPSFISSGPSSSSTSQTTGSSSDGLHDSNSASHARSNSNPANLAVNGKPPLPLHIAVPSPSPKSSLSADSYHSPLDERREIAKHLEIASPKMAHIFLSHDADPMLGTASRVRAQTDETFGAMIVSPRFRVAPSVRFDDSEQLNNEMELQASLRDFYSHAGPESPSIRQMPDSVLVSSRSQSPLCDPSLEDDLMSSFQQVQLARDAFETAKRTQHIQGSPAPSDSSSLSLSPNY
eukprot:ANDGO_07068.mRNA.1 Uncharacterized protein YqkD